ncbi:MAG: hypothetical protein IJG64_04595 [Oscillospiraceae bacterium]|nr:hypothetical protein [Oscillospiraceae bacterium]
MANLLDVLTDGRKGLALFLGGVLFGTAGIRILKTDDARKVYVQGTAAALRGKEEIMETATVLRENLDDIYAQAQEVNEKRAREKEEKDAEAIIEDASEA